VLGTIHMKPGGISSITTAPALADIHAMAIMLKRGPSVRDGATAPVSLFVFESMQRGEAMSKQCF